MTKEEFLQFYSSYFGEEVDNLKQIVMDKFSGEELYDFVTVLINQYNNDWE